jgi:hypothetical protein
MMVLLVALVATMRTKERTHRDKALVLLVEP